MSLLALSLRLILKIYLKYNIENEWTRSFIFNQYNKNLISIDIFTTFIIKIGRFYGSILSDERLKSII